MKTLIPLCLSTLLILGGCAEKTEPHPTIVDELRAWYALNTKPVGPGSIKLREGRCLDTARLPQPWVQINDPSSHKLVIAAPGDEVNIDPHETSGRDADFDGNPYDGRVRVAVTGWSRPPDRWGAYGMWRIAPPAIVDKHIRSGYFQRKDSWPVNELGLEAYVTHTGSAYVDARRFTQCDSYADDGILCAAISADEQFILSVRLSEANSNALPRVLGQLLATVESMRGPCT